MCQLTSLNANIQGYLQLHEMQKTKDQVLRPAAMRQLCQAKSGLRRERVGDQGSSHEGVWARFYHSF
jgi:hypothetical protein